MIKKVILVLIILISYQSKLFAVEPIKWVFTNYPPANYQTETGEFKGFLYDIAIEAFEKRLNIPLQISVFPWTRCQLLVKSGEYDMMLTIPTPERLEYSVTTKKPVWLKKRLIYTYAGHPKMEEFNSINGLKAVKEKGYTILSYLGNGWAERNLERAGIPIIYSNEVEGMYKMLARRRADIIIEEPSIARPSINRLNLNTKIIVTRGVGATSNFNFLIGKKSQHVGILETLNRIVNEMWEDGTIKEIISKYEEPSPE